MNDEQKQRVLAAVSRWLDEHPDEPLPPGLDPALEGAAEPAPDLLELTAAITACRHDVQLQGKLFRRLEGSVTAVLERTAREPATVAGEEFLMDLFDRLRRCLNGAADASQRLPWFVPRARATAALGQVSAGLELVLARVRDQLSTAGIEAFDPHGTAFDPQSMRALGSEQAASGEVSGQVVQTLAAGYRRGDAVLRPADVKVVR